MALQKALGDRAVACNVPDGYLGFSPHWPHALDEIDYVADGVEACVVAAPGQTGRSYIRLAARVFLRMVFGCESSLSWMSVKELLRRDFPRVEHVLAEELNRRLESDAAPVLLDVREEAEYNVSHLPGAVRVQPGSDTSELIETLEPDTPIVTYCSVGYRSSELVQELTEREVHQRQES